MSFLKKGIDFLKLRKEDVNMAVQKINNSQVVAYIKKLPTNNSREFFNIVFNLTI